MGAPLVPWASVPGLDTLSMEKFSPVSNLSLPWHNLGLFPLVPFDLLEWMPPTVKISSHSGTTEKGASAQRQEHPTLLECLRNLCASLQLLEWLRGTLRSISGFVDIHLRSLLAKHQLDPSTCWASGIRHPQELQLKMSSLLAQGTSTSSFGRFGDFPTQYTRWHNVFLDASGG